MSAIANHQRLAHISRITQLEPITVAPTPNAATTGTPAPRNKIQKSRRNRAATAPQSPKHISTHTGGIEPDSGTDSFWSPPTSPVEELQEPQFYRVATDIRISLKGPDPTLEADSEEFKKQAKEIKKDIQRLSRYTRRQHSNPATMVKYSRLQQTSASTNTLPAITTATTIIAPQPLQSQQRPSCSSPPPLPSSPPPILQQRDFEELQHEHEFRRRFSIQEAHDFLSDFLRVHFAGHRDLVTIRTAKTLEEIKMIGNEEDVATGVRQCRRLFNAPVLSDRVGSLLYEELRQGEDLDHSHEFRRFVSDSDEDYSDEDKDRYEDERDAYDYNTRDDDDNNRIMMWMDDEEEIRERREAREMHKIKKKTTKVTPDELRRRRVDDFERSKAEFIEMRQLAAALQSGSGTSITNNNSYGLCRCARPRVGTQAAMALGCMACSPPPFNGRASVPNAMAMAPPPIQEETGGEEERDEELMMAGRKSVDSLLSEVKRRTFRGAGYIAASLAAGYQ